MKHDKIILLVGRSGSGKSTVADILSRQYGRSILPSYTTRPKRFEREEGHIFVNNMFYEKVSRSRDIVAYTYFDKHHYWATAQQVNENDIYIIDPDGVAFFRSHYFGPKQVIVVWLDCIWLVALLRMEKQGRSRDEIDRRITNDNAVFYDPAVVGPNVILHTDNHSPEEIAAQIEEVLEALLNWIFMTISITSIGLSRSLHLATNSITTAIRNQFGRMELSVVATTNVVLPLRST